MLSTLFFSSETSILLHPPEDQRDSAVDHQEIFQALRLCCSQRSSFQQLQATSGMTESRHGRCDNDRKEMEVFLYCFLSFLLRWLMMGCLFFSRPYKADCSFFLFFSCVVLVLLCCSCFLFLRTCFLYFISYCFNSRQKNKMNDFRNQVDYMQSLL
jgi:hypothetical protein